MGGIGAQALDWRLWRRGFALIAAASLGLIAPAHVASGGAVFEGVASCAGSTCHGRAEGNGAVVRQDEIATWQEPSAPSGAHSRAYAVLAGRRGQQIAASLGWGQRLRRRRALAVMLPMRQRLRAGRNSR
jgi:hypothetical protein